MISEIYPWQQQQWQQLELALTSGRLAHAMIFVGPKGTGKNDLAIFLASKILTSKSQQFLGLIEADTHPDLLRLGLSQNSKVIKVDDLRDFISKTALSPKIADQKVAIIDNCEMMTKSSANNFLKVLEEPIGKTSFILISHQQQEIITTILSRCQRFIFPEPNYQIALKWLSNYEIKNPELALGMSNQAPVLAKDYQNLNIEKLYLEILDKFNKLNFQDIFATSRSWSSLSKLVTSNQILSWWQSLINELLKKSLNNKYPLPKIYQQFKHNPETMSLIRFYDQLSAAKIMLKTNISPRLLFDDLLLSWHGIWQKN